MEVARSVGATSIAFPAISTGIFGYPVRAAAEIAVSTTREHAAAFKFVRLVAFDEETFSAYRDMLEREP